MNICKYTPTKYLDNGDINARLRFLFKNVCYLMGTGGGGGIQSIVAGTNVSVDNTDPLNPVVSATDSGVTSLSAIGASPNANAATITGTVLNLQPASASFGGVISMTTQTMGSGTKIFSGPIGLRGTTPSSTGFIYGSTSHTGFPRISLTNTNTGNGAGVGAHYINDVSRSMQYYMGSEANLYAPSAAYIHTDGTNGFRYVHSGVGSKVRWSTGDVIGLESNMYMRWDATSFEHVGIPALTTEDRLLGYVNASGAFSKLTVGSGLTLAGGELDVTEVYFSNRFGGDGSLGNPITPIKVTTTASSATPTPDADASTMFTVTALAAAATFGAPTGTPVNGQDLLIRIKDNGTARTLAWNAIYRAGTDFALPTTTVINLTMYVQFIYNSADTKWDAIGLTQGF